ncbi:unnamed protein product [Protopolystoma xenopodis]|uniref:Uncharacterized protein n=1 Tax=Protopolystoma xenopodis TaxID=117903 RepID=A0A3S5FG57_9PLAT|nr:unnamed protein product [Protopolystoma xenopodis]
MFTRQIVTIAISAASHLGQFNLHSVAMTTKRCLNLAISIIRIFPRRFALTTASVAAPSTSTGTIISRIGPPNTTNGATIANVPSAAAGDARLRSLNLTQNGAQRTCGLKRKATCTAQN